MNDKEGLKEKGVLIGENFNKVFLVLGVLQGTGHHIIGCDFIGVDEAITEKNS